MNPRAAMVSTVTALLWSATVLGGMAAAGAPNPRQPMHPAAPSIVADTPGAPAEPQALQSLRACLGQADSQTTRLLALVLVDESGSLKGSDPADQRVAASRGLISALAGLTRRRPSGGSDVEAVVRLATFADGYRPLEADPAEDAPAWVPLDETSLDPLITSLEQLADRDRGRFTDYVAALDGARADLATEAVDSSAAGYRTCKLLVILTDGGYDVGDRQAEEDGREVLCRAEGLTDGLRGDGVITFAVGLAAASDDAPLRFLEALTVGTADGETCGTTGSPATGLFLPADDADDLFFRLGAVDPARYELSCPAPGSPACVFEVPPGFTGFALRIQTPAPGIGFELSAPSGERATVAAGATIDGDSPLGDIVEAAVRWLGPRQAELTATVKPGADLTGAWSLRFQAADGAPAGGSGRIDVRLRAEIVPVVLGHPHPQAGASTPLELGFVGTDGSPVASSAVPVGATMSVATRDPDSGLVSPLAVTGGGDGRFQAHLPLPADYDRPTVELVLGAVFADPVGVDVAIGDRSVTLAVRPLPGLPTVSPNPILLPGVRGIGRSSATLTITGADSGPVACVWIEPGRLVLPPERGGWGGTGGAPTSSPLQVSAGGDGAGSCLDVGPGARRSVTVGVEPPRAGAGTAAGELVVVIRRPSDPEDHRVTVRVELEMGPAPDEVRRWLIFALLLALGSGVPLGVLAVAARRSTLVGPPQLLRWASTEVTWSVVDGLHATWGVAPPVESFDVVRSGQDRRRGASSITVGALVFRRRFGPGPARLIRSLFAGGRAVVSHREGRPVVAGSPGVALEAYPDEPGHEVPLPLAGTWVFTLLAVDHPGSERDGPPMWHGALTFVVADGDRFDIDAHSLATHAEERLPELLANLVSAAPSRSQPDDDRPGPAGLGPLPIT